jgi:hypothetical protein
MRHGLDRRLRAAEVHRFGSERVAQILRLPTILSDQELIEHILALESGIDMSGFDPRDLTDAELTFLVAEFEAQSGSPPAGLIEAAEEGIKQGEQELTEPT